MSAGRGMGLGLDPDNFRLLVRRDRRARELWPLNMSTFPNVSLTAALLLTGCTAAPASPPEVYAGGFVITSNPAAAWVLVRNCPKCEDRAIAKTPYLSPDPATELKGKYFHVERDGYAPSQIRQLRDTSGLPTERIHEDLVARPGYRSSVSAELAGSAAQTAPAADLRNGFKILSAELRSSYRSADSSEHADYEPLSPSTLFLVVSSRQESASQGVSENASELDQTSGGDIRLLGPREGQQSEPIFSQGRAVGGGLAFEHVFAVPRDRRGPYRLSVDGQSYQLPVTVADTEESASQLVSERGLAPAEESRSSQ
jgi:hypothetical protein